MRLFVIRDVKAEQWMTPFFSRTNGTAYRELSMSVKNADKDNVLAQHPSDFELFVLADWFEGDGVIVPCKAERLGTLADIAGV